MEEACDATNERIVLIINTIQYKEQLYKARATTIINTNKKESELTADLHDTVC